MPLTKEQVAEVVRKTLEEKPPDATHWSLRSMAAASGISRSSVNTIWAADANTILGRVAKNRAAISRSGH